jgi:hypothetical protein
MAVSKKTSTGPSLFYATDKNIFDAVCQHKLDVESLTALFLSRNIVVSAKSKREDLAKYFSTLTHDLSDHRKISEKLGIVPRRERITTLGLMGNIDPAHVANAVESLKAAAEKEGDIVHISKNGENIVVEVQYSTVDYRLTEFSQVQVRDGSIELVKGDTGYTVRSTQNEQVNALRDTLVTAIEKESTSAISKEAVSLFDVTSPKLRSRFFVRLMNELDDLKRLDVTDVFVFKPRPAQASEGDSSQDVHVEKISLRGNGVSQSEWLDQLVTKDSYYIVKVAWIAAENAATTAGSAYEIEAGFEDVRNCTGFSYLLRGVYSVEKDRLGARRRTPSKFEINAISKRVEARARIIAAEIRNELGL